MSERVLITVLDANTWVEVHRQVGEDEDSWRAELHNARRGSKVQSCVRPDGEIAIRALLAGTQWSASPIVYMLERLSDR